MTDAFSIDTTRNAITTALAALKVAYDASRDPRIEDLITGLTDTLQERSADLENLSDQIEADSNPAPWFRSYAAV